MFSSRRLAYGWWREGGKTLSLAAPPVSLPLLTALLEAGGRKVCGWAGLQFGCWGWREVRRVRATTRTWWGAQSIPVLALRG